MGSEGELRFHSFMRVLVNFQILMYPRKKSLFCGTRDTERNL